MEIHHPRESPIGMISNQYCLLDKELEKWKEKFFKITGSGCAVKLVNGGVISQRKIWIGSTAIQTGLSRYSRNGKVRLAGHRPEDEGRKNRSNRAVRVSQYSYYDNDDWPEINNGRGFSKSSAKVHARGFADQYRK
jgi:hypothetical protein